jgi:hypothetical protein
MKTKKKFIYVKPKTMEAEDFFDRKMLGLQSCEVLEEKEQMYLLKPIRTNFSFWMMKKEDENWDLDK